MPKDERRRQKALARKAERQKKRAARHLPGKAPPSLHVAAADGSLHECLVSRTWQEPGEIVQILVARSAGNYIAVAGFLVDLGCLGVKNALTSLLSPAEYARFRRTFASTQPMRPAELNLVAKIIQEGIAYAESFGFRPHPDYREASLLLDGADPAACPTPIPVGVDGKPFFIPGPDDDVPKVLRQLERAVGKGNYHYVLEAGDLILTDEGAGEALEEPPSSFFPGLLRRLRHE
jgi:hypothetical protein